MTRRDGGYPVDSAYRVPVELIPTLGGLLTLGRYPQQFFPQLNVTFIVYPGLSADDIPAGGPRFLDNRTFDGAIPYIVDEAVAAVLRNSAVRSHVEGSGRRDVYDHPAEAVREAVANALLAIGDGVSWRLVSPHPRSMPSRRDNQLRSSGVAERGRGQNLLPWPQARPDQLPTGPEADHGPYRRSTLEAAGRSARQRYP